MLGSDLATRFAEFGGSSASRGQAAIPRRSLVRDGFGYFSGENFAIAG